MKKIKFNKNTKLFLSTLTVGAATAGILAACTPKPDNNVSATAKETVKKLLENENFKTLLKVENTKSKATVLAELAKMVEVDKVNAGLLTKSKEDLGTSENTESKDSTGTIYANIKFLRTKFDAKKEDTAVFTTEQATTFETKFKSLEAAAAKLKEEIGKVPADNTALTTSKTDLETKITAFYDATDVEGSKKALAEMKTALKAFTDKLEENYTNLKTLAESTFALEKATTQLEIYINTDVAKFVEGTDKDPSTALNSLVAKVKTLLGKQGKDLWNGDFPPGIKEDQSTQISQVVALLAGSINAIMEQFKYKKNFLINLNKQFYYKAKIKNLNKIF